MSGKNPQLCPFTRVSTLFWLYRPHAFIFSRISTGYSPCTPSKKKFYCIDVVCTNFHGASDWNLLFQIESGIELIWMFEFLPLLQSLLQKGHGGVDLDGYTVISGRYYYMYMKGTWTAYIWKTPLCYSMHSSAYMSLIYHLATSH